MATKRKNPKTTTERLDYQSAGAVRKRPSAHELAKLKANYLRDHPIETHTDRQARMLALIDRATEEV